MLELEKHLKKCELEWRAKNLPNGSKVDWLAPLCGDLNELADYLRWLGFRIKNIMDEEDCSGWKMQWVETTSGIIVYGDKSDGLVARAVKSKEG